MPRLKTYRYANPPSILSQPINTLEQRAAFCAQLLYGRPHFPHRTSPKRVIHLDGPCCVTICVQPCGRHTPRRVWILLGDLHGSTANTCSSTDKQAILINGLLHSLQKNLGANPPVIDLMVECCKGRLQVSNTSTHTADMAKPHNVDRSRRPPLDELCAWVHGCFAISPNAMKLVSASNQPPCLQFLKANNIRLTNIDVRGACWFKNRLPEGRTAKQVAIDNFAAKLVDAPEQDDFHPYHFRSYDVIYAIVWDGVIDALLDIDILQALKDLQHHMEQWAANGSAKTSLMCAQLQSHLELVLNGARLLLMQSSFVQRVLRHTSTHNKRVLLSSIRNTPPDFSARYPLVRALAEKRQVDLSEEVRKDAKHAIINISTFLVDVYAIAKGIARNTSSYPNKDPFCSPQVNVVYAGTAHTFGITSILQAMGGTVVYATAESRNRRQDYKDIRCIHLSQQYVLPPP